MISGQWPHFAQKAYDVVYTVDRTRTSGRLHHIAFATDICLDHGIHIETGPHKHAIQQTWA